MATKLKTTKKNASRTRTRRPSTKNMKTRPPVKEEPEEVVEEVLEKNAEQNRIIEPKLHPIWPILLVTSILSCIGIPFVAVAERVLIGSLAGCFSLISVFLILRFEKSLHAFYTAHPEMTPANRKKKYQEDKNLRRKQRSNKKRTVSLKR